MNMQQLFLLAICLCTTLTFAMNNDGKVKEINAIVLAKSQDDLSREQAKLRLLAIAQLTHQSSHQIARKIAMRKNNVENQSEEIIQAKTENSQKLSVYLSDPNSSIDEIKQVLQKLIDLA